MEKSSRKPSQQRSNEKKRTFADRTDSSNDFMFNRTSLLSSALLKLQKKNSNASTPRRNN
jgi:hypothetical protein